jgi:hypothetical protein
MSALSPLVGNDGQPSPAVQAQGRALIGKLPIDKHVKEPTAPALFKVFPAMPFSSVGLKKAPGVELSSRVKGPDFRWP